MNQKIFNNLVLLLIVIFIILIISPNPDSILFILKKNFNYFIYQLKKLCQLNKVEKFLNTFHGLSTFEDKSPSFKTYYEIEYINYLKHNNPNSDNKSISKLYYFFDSLVSNNVEQYFLTSNDYNTNIFSQNEIQKIKQILLNKLNSSEYIFTNIILENEPKYYLNSNGKYIEPFIFTIESNYGILKFYIDLIIRNDVHHNKEYIVINQLKPLINKILTNKHNINKPIDNTFTGDHNLVFNNLN